MTIFSQGSNFCSSAKQAFSLILSNVGRVVVLDKVTDFLLFTGKMVITLTVMLLSYVVFSGTLSDNAPFEVDSVDHKTRPRGLRGRPMN